MLKITFLLLSLTANFYAAGDNTNKQEIKLKQELAEEACNCIDSIQTDSRSKKEINAAIKACIDRQTLAFQLGIKLLKTDANKTDSVKMNTNTESGEYKKYYFELERYLLSTCKVLQHKISATDNSQEFSLSKDSKALQYYTDGQKQSERGNYAQAAVSFQKAVKTDPLFAFAWDNLGLCFQHLGRYSEAIETYKHSLSIDSTGLLPLQNIALVYKTQKNYRAATEIYLQMQRITPDNPESYYGLATIQYYQEEYQSGLTNACKAYKLYVNDHSPYRSDAEKLISLFYDEMSANNQTEDFNRIMKENGMETE